MGERPRSCWRTLVKRVGKIELHMPEDREGRLQMEVFVRAQRSGRELTGGLVLMNARGCRHGGGRKSRGGLGGHEFFAPGVSQINGRLEEEL